MADRKGFIDSAVNQYGLTTQEINSALQEAGFNKLNKIESTLIDEGKWGTTALGRAKEGLTDITSGLSTLVSQAANHPIVTGRELGRYVSNNSLPKIIADFYNAATKPVQLDAESLGSNYAEGGIKGVGEGVIAGMVANPTDAAILASPVILKGVAKGARAVANNADKLPLPKFVKNTLRGSISDKGREVNQILRDSKLATSRPIEELKASNISIQNAKTSDLAQAVKNLETGRMAGTPEQINLTQQLKDMTTRIDDMMVQHGFNPDYSKAETINQYATRYFQEAGKDIPVSQIEKLLKDTELANKFGVTPEEVQQVLVKGEQLYRDGFIRPIKHKSTAESVREGFVSEAEKKVKDPRAKMYGTQSYEDVAEGIKAGAYDDIIKTLGKADASYNALNEMTGVVGRKVEPEFTSKVSNKIRSLTDKEYIDKTTDHIWNWMQKNDWKLPKLGFTKEDLKFFIKNKGNKYRINGKTTIAENKIPHELIRLKEGGKRPFQWILDEEFETINGKLSDTTITRKIKDIPLKEDEVVVSPRLLREKIGTALAGGEGVNEPLQSITRGLNKSEMERYADNLYVYKKSDLEALQKAFNVSGRQKGMGLVGDITGIGKTIALATPRYVAGNATTNFLMNPITGTGIGHYARALDSIIGKADEIPQILRRSASYSGYLGEKLPINSEMKVIYEKLVKDLKEGDFSTKWQALNGIVNTPIFKSANSIETLQRSAEFFNQAEKYANKVGKTIDEVIKEANANGGLNKTYRAINKRVEEVLGDYTGRNYYAPEQMTNIANIMLPFYRPFTQAPRQMFNAVKDYPLGTQLGAIIPSRYGKEISDRAKEEYGIEPYRSQGGSPVLAPFNNAPGRVIYNQYHAFSPVGEMINNPGDVLQGNPFLGAMYNIGAGRTRYGEAPLPPNTYKNPDGSYSIMDNNGNVYPYRPEEHFEDSVRFRIAETLKALTPIGGVNSYILPTLARITNQEYARPADTSLLGQIGDTSIPFLMEGAAGRTREGKELILPQLGFNYADTYPERSPEYTPVQVRTTRKRIIKKQARNERR